MKRERGFTMIELMTVVALISTLAAILFPVLASAREAARAGTCRSNLHQIGIALALYSRDYDSGLPPTDNGWVPLITPYLNELLVLRCPSSSLNVDVGAPPNTTRLPGPSMLAANSPELMALPPSYSYSYVYRAGLTRDYPGDSPLASELFFSHFGAAHLLLLNGAVRRAAPGDWPPVFSAPKNWKPRGEGATPLRGLQTARRSGQ